jgi:dolichyl-phosphate-mannose--protein O-mannosyl transferase
MTAVLDREPAPAPDGRGLAQPDPAAHRRARRTGWRRWPSSLVAARCGCTASSSPAAGSSTRSTTPATPRTCSATAWRRPPSAARTRTPSAAERCEPTGEPGFVAHPPLGKWAIALGLRLFGTDELGWRIAAAVAGTLTVLVLVRVTRRMTGSTVLGCLAGLLLALDGLHFVQSRVAMLDVFLVAWVVGAFACLVADRDAVRRRLAAAPDLGGWGPRLGLRPWRLAAGLCLGAALATKWSAVYYLAVLVLLAYAWEVGARRTAGVPAPARATVLRSAGPALAVLAVLPAALYVASWAGWFLADGTASLAWGRNWAADHPAAGSASLVPDPLRSLWHYHVEQYRFHDGLQKDHRYASHPAGWLLLARPVSYYFPSDIGPGDYGCAVDSCARAVLAIGTPAVWWASIPMLVALLWLWVSRRDWRAGATLVLALTAIVPWIRDDLDGRTMFLFYALPGLPFLCLGLALVAGWAVGGAGASLRRRQAGTPWRPSTCRSWS